MQYLHKEREAQILSKYRASLRDDLRTELLGKGVNELEAAYALLQNLDFARTNHPSKVMIIKHQCLDLPNLPNPIGLVPKPLHIWMTSRVRVLNGTTEIRALISPELVLQPSATNVKVMDI